MKLGRFRRNGEVIYGAIEGDQVLSVSGNIADGLQVAGPLCQTEEVRFLPPVEPQSIIAVGINYPRRVEQLYGGSPETQKYEGPVVFLMPRSSVIGHLDDIVFPMISDQLRASGELVVVMKRRARSISEGEVGDYVFGYTCGNDLSCSVPGDLHQTLRAHGFDTATSFGPLIETEALPRNLPIVLRINGEVASQGNTSDMIYSVEMIVSYVSQFMTLTRGSHIHGNTHGRLGERRRRRRSGHRRHRHSEEPGCTSLNRWCCRRGRYSIG